MRAIILGCGSSLGVPRVGNEWGSCNPEEPRNRRSRQGLVVEASSELGVTRLLVDTPPDLRSQLLRAGIGGIDGVVFTHDHADHTHGVYELKAISENRGHQIDAFLAANTWNSLRLRFAPYFASTDEGKSGAFLNDRLVTPGEPFSVRGAGDDIRVSIFRQEHGDTETVGIKVGAFVYSVDLKILPRSSLEELSEVDTWVLDCLRYREHPSHVNLEEALALVQRVKPRLAVLTGLSADFDYRKLTAQLPRGVVVAYDGMILEMR